MQHPLNCKTLYGLMHFHLTSPAIFFILSFCLFSVLFRIRDFFCIQHICNGYRLMNGAFETKRKRFWNDRFLLVAFWHCICKWIGLFSSASCVYMALMVRLAWHISRHSATKTQFNWILLAWRFILHAAWQSKWNQIVAVFSWTNSWILTFLLIKI